MERTSECMRDSLEAESSSLLADRKFEYNPLPDAASYLRLIRVHSSEHDEAPIECSLSVHPLTHPPKYYAVSYTWGDANQTAYISVNGRRLSVRKNCEFVLRQARHHAQDKYFWIDAICINQGDIEEKNHQVAMMGATFGNAEHVMACVGTHSDDSEFAMQCLTEIKPTDWLGSALARWPGYSFFVQAVRWIFNREISELLRISKALRHVLERPYFERVWIIQEVFKKQDRTSLCCGMDRQPFASLFVLRHILFLAQMNIYQYMQNVEGSIVPLPYITRKLLDKCAGGKLEAIDAEWRDRRHEGGSAGFLLASSFSGQRGGSMFANKAGADGKTELSAVVGWTAQFHCQDARDIIFGTLPLVSWKGTRPIAPDYRKTRYKLLTAVLEQWRSAEDVQVYNISILARRLNIDFDDEDLKAAMRIRQRNAADNVDSSGKLRAVKHPGPSSPSDDLICLSHWEGVPLFDQRAGYSVQLKRIGKEDEWLSQEADCGFLHEYNIQIDDTKQSYGRGPLHINVNLICTRDIQEGDWLIHPLCHSPVLVVRPTSGKCFEVVASGFTVKPKHESKAPRGTVWLNYRDGFPSLPSIKFKVWLQIDYAIMWTLACDEMFSGQWQLPIARLKERLRVPVSTGDSIACAKRQ